MVEGARLESVFTGDRNAGSNPALSAIYSIKLIKINLIENCYAETHLMAHLKAVRFEVPGQATEGPSFPERRFMD